METKLNFKEIVPANDILEDEMEFVKGGTDFTSALRAVLQVRSLTRLRAAPRLSPQLSPQHQRLSPQHQRLCLLHQRH